MEIFVAFCAGLVAVLILVVTLIRAVERRWPEPTPSELPAGYPPPPSDEAMKTARRAGWFAGGLFFSIGLFYRYGSKTFYEVPLGELVGLVLLSYLINVTVRLVAPTRDPWA